MKLARLFLAAAAAITLAACTSDSPTAPATSPALDQAENCTDRIAEVQSDGSIIWRCTGHGGSGG